MNMINTLQQMLVLSIIRTQGDLVPVPLTGGWENLDELLRELVSRTYLDETAEGFSVTAIGKQVSTLFDSEIKDAQMGVEHLKNIYANGKYIDARIPISAFILNKYQLPDGNEIVRSGALALAWFEIVEKILEAKAVSTAWADTIANDTVFSPILENVSIDSWKTLGATEEEAKATAEWILNPAGGAN